jgi:beta-galactosidase
VIFSTQYYRPPFPDGRRWAEDFRLIRETGFDNLYVSLYWAWVEPRPGEFVWDDFDRLFELAEAEGLTVVPNLFAEVMPTWIHRELPGSEMVDHMGRDVVSSQMSYFHHGIMPGGCTDNPAVRERLGAFLTATAERYGGAANLRAWDCWNEMRWITQADGFVCHCEHTQAAYREWLSALHGGLDGLNEAWNRRYGSWEDVLVPKLPTRTYTDAMAYQAFLSWRTREHLRFRRDTLAAVDDTHPIVAHAAFPSIFLTGAEFAEFEPALARGNDWELAEEVDAFGCSHFPGWFNKLPAEQGARLESARCAAGDKPHWIAEQQGGAGSHGLGAMPPIEADAQARSIWNGVARGAKAINFWCWRDEAFGREAGGFGIVGADGHAEERLRELSHTAGVLDRHDALLEAYVPDDSPVGVLFEPRAYHLDWAATLPKIGTEGGINGERAGRSLQGYLMALERLQIPYDVVESRHAGDLSRYRFLAMPWPLVVEPELTGPLLAWVRAGGHLLVESELDSFGPEGLYRHPGERPFADALGVRSLGRRPLDEESLPPELRAAGWLEPLAAPDDAEIVASSPLGTLAYTAPLGAGRVWAFGTNAGLAYRDERHDGFERLLARAIERADAFPALRCDHADGEVVQWRTGRSGTDLLLFVVNAGDARDLTFTGAALAGIESAEDLLRAAAVTLGDRTLTLATPRGSSHVLRLR